MSDRTEIVASQDVHLGALLTAPEQVVARATKIANVLANVIKEKKLFSKISGKEYVRVEGWSTLGAMLGVLPREVEVKVIENGYEAHVELLRTSDGMVIGGASAICTKLEKNWSDRDDYAVRSMAITRATGKAYRLGFAWIMELAGYAGTPAEEMVEGQFREAGPRDQYQWEQNILDKIEDLQLTNARKHTVNILELSPFKGMPYGKLEIHDAVAYFIGWLEVKEKNPELEGKDRAPIVLEGWNSEAARVDWANKALNLLGEEE